MAMQAATLNKTLTGAILGLFLLLSILKALDGSAAEPSPISHYDGATGELTVSCVALHDGNGEILL
ncbi:MAG TPA: hypothetical protein VNR18_10400, partial [Hyphomicrobiales bacterium]|nr:hypothetical protein [Hyphomicrobiales bacterium]